MNGYLILAFASAIVAVAAVAWALWERSKGRMQAENARVQAELVSSQVAQSAAGVAEAILKKNEEAIHNREQLAQARLEAQLKPVAESLQKFQEHVALVEKTRVEETGGLKEQIAALLASTATQDEARKLSVALEEWRGRAGPLGRTDAAQCAGASGPFQLLRFHRTGLDRHRGRPPAPGRGREAARRRCLRDRRQVLAERFPELQDAEGEDAREAAGLRHVQSVRGHIAGLSAKAYWDQFDGSPDFVAMFVPLDSALAAAVDPAPALMTEAKDRKVVIVTPTTLFALCKAVVYGWRVEEQAANARTIAELGRELYKRIATMGAHAGSVGKALEAAVARYNQFVGSLETQVLTQARRFEELKVDHEGRKVEVLEPLDTAVRPLAKLPTEPPPQVRLVKGDEA